MEKTEQLKELDTVPFLNNITEFIEKDLILFKSMYRIYQPKHSPKITFKIAADWEGNWFAGHWYEHNYIIGGMEELLQSLNKEDASDLVYYFDTVNRFSDWGVSKYARII